METIQENPRTLLVNEEHVALFQAEDPVPLNLSQLKELLVKTGLDEIEQIVLLGTPVPTFSWVINLSQPVTRQTTSLPEMEAALVELPDSLLQDLFNTIAIMDRPSIGQTNTAILD